MLVCGLVCGSALSGMLVVGACRARRAGSALAKGSYSAPTSSGHRRAPTHLPLTVNVYSIVSLFQNNQDGPDLGNRGSAVRGPFPIKFLTRAI
jgi:hypothetical protein